jgi:hypothetical protein
MIKTTVGFRLSAYLKDISCQLTLNTGEIIPLPNVSYCDWVFGKYDGQTMVHEFWANGVADLATIKDGVGTLRVRYRLSFTDHPCEGYKSFKMIVPLVKRKTVFDSKYRRAQQIVGREPREPVSHEAFVNLS